MDSFRSLSDSKLFGRTFSRTKDRSGPQSGPSKKTRVADTSPAPSPITQGSANKTRNVINKSPAAEAFLTSWLRACQRPELMESQPNPKPHPQFQWHTHEQCLYAILAAQRPRDRSELMFCFV